MVLNSNATERDIELAQMLIQKTETTCMISRAIQGNGEMELQVTVVVTYLWSTPTWQKLLNFDSLVND